MADLDVRITDGRGQGGKACVSEYDAVNTHLLLPPLNKAGTPPRRRPFVTRVDLDNGGTGWDGSTAPVEITLLEADSSNTFSYYIQNIVIILAGASVPYNRFAGINGGITNGIDLFSEVSGVEDYLAQNITTNGEFLLYAGGGDLMPSNPATISNYTGTADALIVTFDLNEMIPESGGISGLELNRGTFDKIVYRIKDDLTVGGVTDSFALLKGYKLYE